MTYTTRLAHNYFELSRFQRIRYTLLTRGKLSEADRFFFEGRRSIPGQMYLAERRAIHDTILQYKPRCCFEVGKCAGGGSTFFMASTFAEIGEGYVVTMESDPRLLARAKAAFANHLPQLFPLDPAGSHSISGGVLASLQEDRPCWV